MIISHVHLSFFSFWLNFTPPVFQIINMSNLVTVLLYLLVYRAINLPHCTYTRTLDSCETTISFFSFLLSFAQSLSSDFSFSLQPPPYLVISTFSYLPVAFSSSPPCHYCLLLLSITSPYHFLVVCITTIFFWYVPTLPPSPPSLLSSNQPILVGMGQY